MATDLQWAVAMLKAGFPANEKVIGEGLACINNESSGDEKSEVPGNEHIGGWAESKVFGSRECRLDVQCSTNAAFKQWSADGKSFYKAWGQWQIQQGGKDLRKEWQKYRQPATLAIAGHGNPFALASDMAIQDSPGDVLSNVNPLKGLELIGTAIEAFVRLVEHMFEASFWVRVGKGLLGVALLLFAINGMFKATLGMDLGPIASSVISSKI